MLWGRKRKRLLAALEEAKRLHVYTFDHPDVDGNVNRANAVEGLLDEAIALVKR